MTPSAVVQRAVAAYDGQPRGVRFHVRARARTCPVAELEARTPKAGRVLDFGCGHGLLALALALASADRDVTGVDIDAAKLPFARAAAVAAGAANVDYRTIPPDWEPDGAWDAIVVADVLYLMGAPVARAVLARLANALAPGGVLLVKEIDVEPRWKYELARVQELVATRVTRITEGATVDFVAPDEIASALREADLEVEHVSLHRGRMHPHHLVVGRRGR